VLGIPPTISSSEAAARHRHPRPEQLEASNPKHAALYDWQHIDLAPHLPEDHYFHTNLNRIRLDELRTSRATLEEAYFRLTRDAATHSAAPVAAERSVA